MTLEKEWTKDKYYEELKWGSYFFISSVLASFVFAFLILGLFDKAEDFYFAYTVLQFSIILIYCSIKAISEKAQEERLRFFAKLWMGVKVFGIYCFFWTIISGGEFLSSHSLLMRESNYLLVRQEEELLPDNKNTLLNEFMNFLKRKTYK